MKQTFLLFRLFVMAVADASAGALDYTVSWLGNSFSGASNKWAQNFCIHTKVESDGTVNTWIDILTGITVRRRRDGEYLVFVDENYRAKVLMYRWKP